MKQIVILLSAVLCASACVNFGAGDADSQTRALLPGECLKSTELSYYATDLSYMCDYGKYVFCLQLNLDYSNECMDHTVIKNSWRHVPTQEMYDAFGENGKLVKKAYEDEFESFQYLYNEKYPWYSGRYSIVTILYNTTINVLGLAKIILSNLFPRFGSKGKKK